MLVTELASGIQTMNLHVKSKITDINYWHSTHNILANNINKNNK